jgi:hypothetical protein
VVTRETAIGGVSSSAYSVCGVTIARWVRAGFVKRIGSATILRQARILLQRFLGFENRVAFTGVQCCGLPLPSILHLLQPRQVPEPGVVVFVELRLPYLFVHGRK